MNKKNNRKGFTIVELVIVIAVIAILATVLIPTFGNMIQKANNSKLLQELRNEYTEYTVWAAENGNVSDDIVIKMGDDYYQITNGEIDNPPVAMENDPTTGYYWDAAAESENAWTPVANAPAQGGETSNA